MKLLSVALAGLLTLGLAQTKIGLRIVPTVPSGVTLQESDLTYEGAFRVPDQSGVDCAPGNNSCTLSYGASAIAYNPTNDSIFVNATIGTQEGRDTLVEVSIPSGLNPADTQVSDLPFATLLQDYGRVTEGEAQSHFNGQHYEMSGIKVLDSTHLLIMYQIQTTGEILDQAAAAIVSSDLANPNFQGWFKISSNGTTTDNSCTYPTCDASTYNGDMADIPARWQAALGGDTLSSNCCYTSSLLPSAGPSFISWNKSDIGVTITSPGYLLNFYAPTTHPMLGTNIGLVGDAGASYHFFTSNNGEATMFWPEDYDGPVTMHTWGDPLQACYGSPVGALDGDGRTYEPVNRLFSGSDASVDAVDGTKVYLPNVNTSVLVVLPSPPGGQGKFMVWLPSQTTPVLTVGTFGNPGEYGWDLWNSKRGYTGASRIQSAGDSGTAGAYVIVSDAFPTGLTGETYHAGESTCYDPMAAHGTNSVGGSGHGPMAWPYVFHFLSYDANDLAAVKAATKSVWEPLPAHHWTWTPLITGGVQVGDAQSFKPGSMAWDSAGRRLFISQREVDAPAANGIIHVFTVAEAQPKPNAKPVLAGLALLPMLVLLRRKLN